MEDSTDVLKYRALCLTDLWSPSADFRKPAGIAMERIAEEALNSPALTEYPAYKAPMGRSMALLGKLGLPPKSAAAEGVAIPEVRQIPDYASGWDDSLTSQFQSAYKHGYISLREPESSHTTSATPLTSPIKRPRSRSSRRSVLKQSTTIPVAPSPSPGRRGRSANKKGHHGTPSRLPSRLASPPEEASTTPVRPTKSSRLWQHFHPTRWTHVEIEFAKVLFEIFGSDWQAISRYMCRTKAPAVLERAFKRCDGDFKKIEATTFEHLKCEVCKLDARLSEAVFCDSCYRSYHLRCTYPVLDQIPETDWFCSNNCSKLGTLNCKTCRKATDDNLILVCDKCERGAHMYCLAEPLKEIPEGEWFCDECSITTPRSSATSHSKHSTSNVTSRVTARAASRANDVIQASKECSHEHGLRSAASELNSAHSSARQSSSSSSTSTLPSGPVPAISSSNNSLSASGASNNPTHTQQHRAHILDTRIDVPAVSPLAYLLLTYAVDVPWEEMVNLSQLCVDCLIEQDGGVVPSKLGDFVTGHALLPQSFRNSIFVNQIDDVPFTSSGDVPDPAALNAHLDTLLMAADAAVNRALTKPLLAHLAPAGYVPPPAPSLTATAPRTPNARGQRFSSPPPSIERKTPLRGAAATAAAVAAAAAAEPRRGRRPSGVGLSPARGRSLTTATVPTPPSASVGRARSRSKSSANTTIDEWLVEGGYDATDSCYWIFQANPGFYDINASLKQLHTMTWVVRQNQSRIRKGDRVFVWESGKDSGLIALGTILTDPTVSREMPAMKAFTKDATKFDRPDVRCQIQIEYVLPAKMRRADIAAEPGLATLTILRAPIGTNFKVTKPEAGCLLARLAVIHPNTNAFKAFGCAGPSSLASTNVPSAAAAAAAATSAAMTSANASSAPSAVPSIAPSIAAIASPQPSKPAPLPSPARTTRSTAPATPTSSRSNAATTAAAKHLGAHPSPASTGIANGHANGISHAKDSVDLSTASESTSDEQIPSSSTATTVVVTTNTASSATMTFVSSTPVVSTSGAANGHASSHGAVKSAPHASNGDDGATTDDTNGSTAMDVDEDVSVMVRVKADIVRSLGPEGLNAFNGYDEKSDSEYVVNSSMEISDIEVSEDSTTESDSSTPSGIATDEDEEDTAVSRSQEDAANGDDNGVATDDEAEDEAGGYEDDVEDEAEAEEDEEIGEDEEEDEEDEEGEEEEEDGETNDSKMTVDESDDDEEEDGEDTDEESSESESALNGSSMDVDSKVAPSTPLKSSTAASNGYGSDSDGGATDGDVPTDSDDSDDDGEYSKPNGPSELNAAGLTRNRQRLLEVNDPSLAMRFPLKLVQSAATNSRRMRLSVHIGSSVLIAVSGGRELKKKSTGKIPLVPVSHASAVHTFIAKTPGGWKFKLAPVPDEDIPHCGSCAFPLMKSPVVSCNTCGKSHHAQCALRVKGGGPVTLSAPPTHASLHASNGLSTINGTMAHAGDFTCSACTHHGDNPTCGKCRRVVRTDYFSCDSCDEPYHLSCMGLKQAPRDVPWLCARCDVSRTAFMRIKLAFVLRELRLEVLRLTTACVDIGAARLRRCIESPDKAGSPISTLGHITEAARNGCAVIAQQALERWNLYRATAKIDFVD